MNRRILTGLFAVFMLSIMSTGNAFAMTFDVDNGGPVPPNPPGGTSGTATFTVSVSQECTVEDLDLRLALSHTFDADLILSLQSPLGTNVVLSTQNGGGGNDYFITLFDDEAGTPIGAGVAPFNGAFIPEQPLSNFDTENPNGVWILTVDDVLLGDIGTLWKTGDAILAGGPGTQLIFNGNAECSVIVGGEIVPLDTTALILAGAQTNTVWIMSALAVIGSMTIGALYITSKKN